MAQPPYSKRRFRVHWLPSGRSCSAGPEDTLLEAAARSGLSLPQACRNGNCLRCEATLLEGQTVRPPGDLPRTQGMVLPCVDRAASDLVLQNPAVGVQQHRILACQPQPERRRLDGWTEHRLLAPAGTRDGQALERGQLATPLGKVPLYFSGVLDARILVTALPPQPHWPTARLHEMAHRILAGDPVVQVELTTMRPWKREERTTLAVDGFGLAATHSAPAGTEVIWLAAQAPPAWLQCTPWHHAQGCGSAVICLCQPSLLKLRGRALQSAGYRLQHTEVQWPN